MTWTPTADPLSCSAIEALGKTLIFYVNGKGFICYLEAPTGQIGPTSNESYSTNTITRQAQDPGSDEIKQLPVKSNGPQVSAVTWINGEGQTEIRVYYVGLDSQGGTFKLRELKSTSPDKINLGPWHPGGLNHKDISCLETSIVAANVNYWGNSTAGDVKIYYQRLTTTPSVAYALVTSGGDWSNTDITNVTWT